MIKINTYILLVAALAASCSGNRKVISSKHVNPYQYTINKKVTGTHAAVVSAHPLASEAGLAIMKMGGNAIDAAITTQLALAVVYPAAGNIGGGGFLVAHLSGGKNLTLDYREKAPGKATRDMYLDKDGNAITSLSVNGHLAAGVPGTVAGLFAAAPHGKLPFKKLIQPAIDLAEFGYVITADEAADLNRSREAFVKYNTVTPAFVKATPWKAGDTLVQKDLANTLKRIRDKGKAGFYEGETARLIVEEMQRGKGIISYEDLKNYAASDRQPSVFDYKGYTIVTMPLPSSGGVLLPQMMKMIEDKPIKSYGFQTLQSVQLMTEVERRAYADRAKFLGDVDFFKVPVKTLTSDAYAKERMRDYDPAKAGTSAAVQAGIVPESEETTHLSVYDHEGNAVSVTTTLNGGYGSKTVVGGAGFFLNNEMDDFSVKPGVPNMYGAVGGDANAIVPGKRMLSSMTPTVVLKDGKPYIVAGTPGGTTITTSVFQTLVNILEFGMNADDAVNKPKFHHQWLPDEIMVEKDFPQDVREQLQKMGYKVTVRNAIGRTEVIRILPNGSFEAVGDKRGDDHAAGY
ncbi:gamma-glutamyltransferase [Paraflavitalea sp. CAU 1676]|uniref:gamma-glutamyltransferase n=1 Tax=Paraflavitalea sp. CAU 1676 TaxID=3032598 RepID=UPI0023DBD6F6|nr:gamma-glutamyltransferase [Paraflavitalea sp. CAU 1676]MDF2190213.1 gamma-glutamyltransferase [Paraflavitalea sp. CAU 1676]